MPEFRETNEYLTETESDWQAYADWHDWVNQDTPPPEPGE